jgi:hypothetical protein
LSIPNPKPLPRRTKPVPYVCVGDDAFGLTWYMTKPYANTGLTQQKRIFNYRLWRCQRISENGRMFLGECSSSSIPQPNIWGKRYSPGIY